MPALTPRAPHVRFVAHLLEDFGDESLWRPALYYRWAYDGLQVFLEDNRRAVSGGTTADVPVDCVVWNTPQNRWDLCSVPLEYAVEERFPTPEITASSAEDAYVDVLDQSGAYQRLDADGEWLNARDATDTRVVADVEAGTGSMINSLAAFQALGGWPTLDAGTPPTDTDSDGMPDAWETAQCLAPNVANPSADPDGDGYTNIEEFLNHTDASPDHDNDGIPTGCDIYCSDGYDNDSDNKIDYPADPGCSSASDTTEGNGGCGLLGIELLPLLLWAARPWRKKVDAV